MPPDRSATQEWSRHVVVKTTPASLKPVFSRARGPPSGTIPGTIVRY
jgi:hypothetical protein